MKKAVFCLARDRCHAYVIVRDLLKTGFQDSEISLLVSEVRESHHPIGHEKHTKAPVCAALGSLVVGIIGGAFGFLSGTGVIALPHATTMLDIGPVYAALSCATIGGSIGYLLGVAIGLTMPEYVVRSYEPSVREANALLSVHVENTYDEKKAIEVFEQTGAEGIGAAPEETFISGSI
jgi:hypothetical protein